MHYLVYNSSQIPPAAPADAALLDAHEQEAYARHGAPYLARRMLLRRELARLTGLQVQGIRLQYGENGKPHFPPQPFNMSHSRDCLCLAFHHREIGVDVEYMRPRPFAALAERFMAAPQLAAFMERGCPQQEFYACWCAAEALVKHAGSGIWHAQGRFPFLYDAGRIVPQFPDAPQVELFSPAPGFMGALAFSP
ncbi:MAG: 4'-phosphopantetheinyl transferase superfamily protein [Akkermansia sp.]|nr:4'-phosphopantetheinyl transferase superfamily protein [Akkermansia sp.]